MCFGVVCILCAQFAFFTKSEKTYKNKQECKIYIMKKIFEAKKKDCIYVQDDELILMLILG